MEANLIVIVSFALALGIVVGIAIGIFLKKKSSSIRRGVISISSSKVSGRGAFATENIKDGAVIERCPALEVTDRDIGGELVNYVFYGNNETARLVVMGYGMLFNHSSTPNVAYYREDSALGPELVLYAIGNISKGDELFYNYGDDWWTTRQ
ncbi:MAG: SET domain-containing protein-lysine N-methyltransferase [Chlorobiaceae bacterium]